MGERATASERVLNCWRRDFAGVPDRTAAAGRERLRLDSCLIHTFAHVSDEPPHVRVRLQLRRAARAALRFRTGRTLRWRRVLIYTAAGDAEGTMGGLVRMGKPGSASSRRSRAALRDADMVRGRPGLHGARGTAGQGPDSCNLAACHNCALVPETACEEFNRFLDRGVVVGDADDRDIGSFSEDATAL